MTKPNCPLCEIDLTGFKIGEGIGWKCTKCDGRAINLTVFKAASDPKKIQTFWVEASKSTQVSPKKCPTCAKLMKKHLSKTQLGDIELDFCTICRFLWFDREELEAMPAKVAEEPKFGAPREASFDAKFQVQPESTFFFRSLSHMLRRGF